MSTRQSLLKRRMRVSRLLNNHVYNTELQVEALNEMLAIDKDLAELQQPSHQPAGQTQGHHS